MDFLIFDYNNQAKTVHTDPNKTIEHLTVDIISGDEIVFIAYTDGTYDSVDSTITPRIMDFYDGGYIITPDEIEDWVAAADNQINADSQNHVISYQRQDWAYARENKKFLG